MTVKLEDVAKLAGVSVGTASQALNSNPKVAIETRSRVLDAAKTLGYVFKERISFYPQNTKQTLSAVGVLSKHDPTDIILVNPFYAYIFAGLAEECEKNGIGLMFGTVRLDEQNQPIEWPPMITNNLVNGLILAGSLIEKSAGHILKHTNLPLVMIDGYAPGVFVDNIVTDNLHGASLAVNYLADLGHKKIGLIGWHQKSPQSIVERKQGYTETLQARGLDSQSYIVESSHLESHTSYDAVMVLMERYPDVTAIFACNDTAAIGVIDGLKQTGRKIPDDVSVVGFDNVLQVEDTSPPLTTIHIHKNWMGIMGARLLIERAANPEKPKTTTLLSTQLVIRKSTAPPPAK